jgi:hypothetical protein
MERELFFFFETAVLRSQKQSRPSKGAEPLGAKQLRGVAIPKVLLLWRGVAIPKVLLLWRGVRNPKGSAPLEGRSNPKGSAPLEGRTPLRVTK